MQYKQLETSSIKLSSIGQGLGIGGALAKQAKYDKHHADAFSRGIELGMNFVDTAEIYGEGQAETLIGDAIWGRRDSVFISTKFSPKNNGFDDVLKAAEGSLRRLRTDHIDLYQMHWPNPNIPLKETMRALEQLKAEGKIRHIGVSNCSLKQMKEAQRLCSSKIFSTQVEYNLFDRSIETAILPFCLEERMWTIAYSPLNQGRIVNGSEKLRILGSIASKYEKTAAQVTLNWLVSHPTVIAIPNTSSGRHQEENAQAVDFELSAEDLETINGVFKQAHDLIPTEQICVVPDENANVFRSREEALANKLGYSPSPSELAEELSTGEALKPIRVTRRRTDDQDYLYDLAEGRSRYWAWVIAHNNREPIPAYIREE